MAHISGWNAGQYREVVSGVGASTAFTLSTEAKAGPKPLGRLSNGDTIMYKATCLDDASKWEIGLGTFTASTKLLARTTILASSNSNSAVDFTKSDGSGTNVLLEGLQGLPSTASAYTVTNISSAGRTLSATESTAANIAKVLAALIQDLNTAGVLKGSIS